MKPQAKKTRLSGWVALTLAALALAALALAGVWTAPAQAATTKNVILFINDGMQLEHEIAASRYLYGTDKGLAWYNLPYHTYSSTWDVTAYNKYAKDQGEKAWSAASFNPLVGYWPAYGGDAPYPDGSPVNDLYFFNPVRPYATDSASAATAMSTGYKTDDGNLAWLSGDPANGSLSTIAEKLRSQYGKAIGVVSTVSFNHASPAAFVSHNVNRNNYSATASTAALEVLGKDSDGFFLMVEQGDIDWANHANNFKDLIGSMTDAERAMQSIINYVNQPGDGIDWGNILLIVTSDHSNSYMRLQQNLGQGNLPAQATGGTNEYGESTFKYPGGEVTYATTNHTNELVTLHAIDAGYDLFRAYEGAWYPGTRIVDNTNIYGVMAAATGVR